MKDILIKMRKYQNAGVREYWMVDPDAETVTWILYKPPTEDYPDGDMKMEIYPFSTPVPVGIFNDECVMNLHLHAVLIRVLWRWYQNLRAFLKLSVLRYLTAVPVSPFRPFPAGRTYPGLSMSPLSFGIFHSLP